MNKKLKIAFFIGTFPVISESWLVEQITDLIDMGVEIDIFAFNKGKASAISDKVKKYGLMGRTIYLEFPENKFHRIALATLAFARCIYYSPITLFRSLNYKEYGKSVLTFKYLLWAAPLLGKIDRYDVVHCHFGMIANRYLILRDILNIRQNFIVTFYGQDSSKYIQSKGLHVYDKLKKEASMILVMTEEMRDRFVGLGFPPEKLVVHYTGIIPQNYNFNEKSYRFGEKSKIIFVGRFVEKKGIEDLLRATRVIVEEYPNVELHVVGDGDAIYKKNIKELAKRLGVANFIKFEGMLTHQNTLELFYGMHLMVQPSKKAPNGDTDDLPFVLLEGQASGLPVVSTDHVGIPDGIDNGKTGFIVKEGDFRAVAEKVKAFIENPGLLKEFSLNARIFVVEKFDLPKINRRLVSLYKELIIDKH